MNDKDLNELGKLLTKFLDWQWNGVELFSELETTMDLPWIKDLRDDVKRIKDYKKKYGMKHEKRSATW